MKLFRVLKLTHCPRLYEEEHQSAVDVRTDTLQTLRELGPPDLVHLVKQPNNSKSVNKQVWQDSSL